MVWASAVNTKPGTTSNSKVSNINFNKKNSKSYFKNVILIFVAKFENSKLVPTMHQHT